MGDGLRRAWIEPMAVEVPPALAAAVGGHPLVTRTLVRRGLTEPRTALGFLDPRHYTATPPWELPAMEQAVERLLKALRQGERICVWGDFDVDGQMATTLLVSTLRTLGGQVTFHIPVRGLETHGISPTVLDQVLAPGVDVLLTCDTGVNAHAAVEHARARGVDVVITDHHELPPLLPPAHAIVNPKLLPEPHPLRELPGVGCAYKLAEALCISAGQPELPEQHLDLVALGIVADVAVVTGDTRYLLQRGLEAIRRAQRPALRAMLELAELNPQWLTEEHLGFVLAPRLNALGRLDDANRAIPFLLTEDIGAARITAAELEGLNLRRKSLTDAITQAAIAQIERDPRLLESAALVVSDPHWSGGVIGIVAGRLAERYGRPALVIATPPGERARGSARSVPGCNITAALAANAALLAEFGGHPLAAGFSLDAERIGELRRALSETVRQLCGPAAGRPPLQIDGYVALADLSLDLVEEIERLAPFGAGNEPLVLATRGLHLLHDEEVGRSNEHLQLIVEDEHGATQRLIWWQGATWRQTGLPLPEGRFDLAYTVRASDFRGQRGIQLEWVDARPHDERPAALRTRPSVAVTDWRHIASPQAALEALRAQEQGLLVWREGDAEVEGVDRTRLEQARALAIWTTPPGPRELASALERVGPQRVYLFGIAPPLGDADRFLALLAGLVKHALSARDGAVSVSALAAATAHREATVRAGIGWLASRGYIEVQREEGDLLVLARGRGAPQPDEAARADARLREMLEETAAYRRAFARAHAEALVGGS